jgi:predicted AAA+ superfamily ATPase
VEKTISDISKITGENEKTIYELFRLMANSDAQIFEINNLAGILKVNRNLVSHYIDLLEKAFLIKISYNYTASVARQIRTSKKQYCAHSSIVIAMLDYPFEVINTEIVGHLVESTIANNIDKPAFWRTPQNEVDMVLKKDNATIPIEVKYKAHLDKKDVKSMLKFMEKFKAKKGLIITKDVAKQEKLDGRQLIYTPAWLFLLNGAKIP